MTLTPDGSAMGQHLEWLTTGAPIDYRFEIAWGNPDQGPTNGRTFRLDDVASAVDVATQANLAGQNVYVGVTLKHSETPEFGRTSIAHAAVATGIAVDFDRAFLSGARRLGSIARPQLILITGRQPSLRAHLWVRMSPMYKLKIWDHVTREVVAYCEADANAVGINRLMRLAGTISYPSSAKRSRGYGVEPTQLISRGTESYLAADILAALSHAPKAPSQPASSDKIDRIPVNVTNAAIICSALNALPPIFVEEYQPWLSIGFALHDFSPGPVGLSLWKKHSARCPAKAAVTDFGRYWSRFGRRSDGNQVTIGSLIHHAKEAGWRAPAAWDRTNRLN
jgi:hypothetical protein